MDSWARPKDLLYLHFLNRELFRALDVEFNKRDVLDALDILLLGTAARFATTIAFLFESRLSAAGGTDRLEMLVRSGDLEVISEYPTTDSFVGACQSLYAFDQTRYDVYFSLPRGDQPRWAPTLFKDVSTTGFLETRLSLLGEEAVVPEDVPLLHGDKVAVVSMCEGIAETAKRRDGRAITLSLFETQHLGAPARLGALARLLSGLHLAHYLDFTGAAIATGLLGLSYFDRFSRVSPAHDVSSIAIVCDLIGMNVGVRRQLCEASEIWRHSSEHALFVNAVGQLTRGLYEASVAEAGMAWRAAFANQARRLAVRVGADRWQRERLNGVGLARFLDRISLVTRMAEELPRFAEFRARCASMALTNTKRLLILTTTAVEIDELIRRFGDGGRVYKREFFREHTLYHFGVLKGLEVIAIQAEMGTEAPPAMTLTAADVVDAVLPDFMILVGIGFGLRPGEQRIGDVMVSRQLRLYDPKKVTSRGGRERTILRGDRPSASALLLDRCRDARMDWSGSAVHFGLLWAGNTLVDSSAFVARLKRLEPEAIGGEMEGAGVYCVGAKRKVDWIIIKAIADWGMGKSDRDQVRAAANAVGFLMVLLEQGGLSSPLTAMGR